MKAKRRNFPYNRQKRTDPAYLSRLSLPWALIVMCLAGFNAYSSDLADVYADAKVGDPVSGAAQANFRAIRENVPQARSRMLPSLNLGVSTTKSEIDFPGATDANPFSPTFGQSIPGENYNENGWNAQLRQSIINLSLIHI